MYTLLIPLCFNGHLAAQTVFPLDPNNVEQTVTDILTFLDGRPSPSQSSLHNFLSIPTRNRVYKNSPNHCTGPQINVSENSYGFMFNFPGFHVPINTPDMLYIQQMDNRGLNPITTANYGPRGYNGFNLQHNHAQNRIFLVGAFCSNCTSPSLSYCVSNWEVIIIEKSIL